jgi:predicted acyl esterase
MKSIINYILILSCLSAFEVSAQMTPTFTASIPMRDGKSLAADVYVPVSCDSCPTILIQTPYNKNAFRNGLPLGILQNLNASPYSWVIVDWRGFYASQSAIVAQPDRGKDGYDVIEWIVSQSWSNGKVGTWGPSALGVIQYQTAKEKHPNHICAVPQVATPQQSYDGYFFGGVLEKSYLQQLDALGYGLSATVLANPYYSNTWTFAENNSWYPQDITIPTLQVGGWYDHNINKMIEWYKATKTSAAAQVRNQQWLLVGPWVHGGTGSAYVGSANQGELSYPNAAFMSDTMARNFFAYYLRSSNNGWQNTPAITYYKTGANIWANDVDSSIESSTSSELFLSENNVLRSSTGAGISDFVCDPKSPSPTIGGQTLSTGLSQGPYNQNTLDSRNDITTFSTDFLTNDVAISGRVKANLYIQCNKPDADIVVRVVDVYPDGRSMLINDGIRRMRFRNGYRKTDESFMNPSNIYNVEVQMPFINYTWKAGHKIKIYVSGNSSTRWDVNLQNGDSMYVAGDTMTANIQIHHSTQYPSKLILPGNSPLVSVKDIDFESNAIYPNPTNDKLFIQSDINAKSYEIYDLSGKLLRRDNVNASAINVGDLNSGMYFISLQTATSRFKAKFIRE